MKELAVFGLVAAFIATVHGYAAPAGLEGGDCAKPTVKNNFSIQKFQGAWYEAQTAPNIFTLTKKCTKMEYYWDGNVVKATTKGRDEDDQPTEQSTEMIWSKSSNKLAHFIVQVKEMPDLEVPFQILSTDYINYACVYSCTKYQDFKISMSWALVRDISKAKDATQVCRRIFQKNNIDISKLIDTYQGPQCDAPPPPRLRNGGLPSYMSYKPRSKNNGDKKNTREQKTNNNFGNRNKNTNRNPTQSSWKPSTSQNDRKNDNGVKVSSWKPYRGYQRNNQQKDTKVQIKKQSQTPYTPYKPYQSVETKNKNSGSQPYVGYRSRKEENKNTPNKWIQSKSSQQDKGDVSVKKPNVYEKDNKYNNWSSYKGYQKEKTNNNISYKNRNANKNYWGITEKNNENQKGATKMVEYKKDWNRKDFNRKTVYQTNVDTDGRETYDRKEIYVRKPYQRRQSSVKPRSGTSRVKTYQKDEATTRSNQQKNRKNSNAYASVVTGSDCKDKEKSCEYWASLKECERNPSWMNDNCKKSCGKCDNSASSCVDKDAGCQGWSNMGECRKNPTWMNDNCPRACKKCS